jgi:uncharacterized protein (DUF433 family)
MDTITTEQLYSEISNLKQQIAQLRETVAQYHVVQTTHPHIVKIEGHQGGEPMVRNARVTVRTIIEQTRLGTTPEELIKGYPPLTFAEIYDALSYYYDHTEEIEGIIAGHDAALERAKEFIARNVTPPAKTQ